MMSLRVCLATSVGWVGWGSEVMMADSSPAVQVMILLAPEASFEGVIRVMILLAPEADFEGVIRVLFLHCSEKIVGSLAAVHFENQVMMLGVRILILVVMDRVQVARRMLADSVQMIHHARVQIQSQAQKTHAQVL